MGAPVFGNEFFDQWLNQISIEILAKVEREKISNEDMLILSLQAVVNHFHHMDIKFRDEFKKIERRFEQVDKRFDRQATYQMWAFGLILSTQFGIIYKLFL